MRGLPLVESEASASRAIKPPSPLLSARMMSTTYLTETMDVSAQKNSDRTPRTLSGVIGTCPLTKDLLEGIEDTGTDIPVDHTDGAQG